MKKKLIAIVMVVALATTAIVGSTLAYFTDTDEDVNTMVFGNVSIDQLEYERKVDADGKWIATTTADKYGYYPDELQEFTQDKPIYPRVGEPAWDNRNGSEAASGEGSHQQSWAQVGASGSNQLFDDSTKNVVDKFVFVKNDGSSDVYVRTWFAFEKGSFDGTEYSHFAVNRNNKHWIWHEDDQGHAKYYEVEINGVNYLVTYATYKGPSAGVGKLAPGAVSYPSLLQLYICPEVTLEDADLIDGNNNGKFDVLVFSQAVQTAGFDNNTLGDADAAFETAFGAPVATDAEGNVTVNHPWAE